MGPFPEACSSKSKMNPYVLGHWEDNLDVAYAMEHWESGDLGLGEIAYDMCKNDTALGMFPDKTTLGSRYSGCVPTAQQDRSTVTWQGFDSRTGRHASGCPFCGGDKACKCHSLRTHYPRLASEWDFVKNKGTPDDHTAHSDYMAWWTSPMRERWQQSIADRASLVDRERQRRLIKQHGLRLTRSVLASHPTVLLKHILLAAWS